MSVVRYHCPSCKARLITEVGGGFRVRPGNAIYYPDTRTYTGTCKCGQAFSCRMQEEKTEEGRTVEGEKAA